jgi:hypothetical protein
VIDAHLAPWERRLRDTEGPLLAMRSLAAVIAGFLPAETAEEIRHITGNQELATFDEHMQPAANPALPQIASALPADAAFQITRTAERLGFTDYSDVLAEVANIVIRKTAIPDGNSPNTAPALLGGSFPQSPLVPHVNAEFAAARKNRSKSASKPKRPAAKNLVRLNRAAGYDVEEQALRALHTGHLRHRIREVLTALPDEQRRAIRLRLSEARSGAEIAPLLGVKPQQVSRLWNRGFTTLWSALRAGSAVWRGTRKDQRAARHDRELCGSRAGRR